MFVKTTIRKPGDKSYTYLSLVEAERRDGKNTHRTLLRLGEVSELRDSGQLDRIVAALSSHASGTWTEASTLSCAEAPGFGAMAAARAYFCRLGLEEHFTSLNASRHLADAVFVMVANRLLRPWSKRRTIGEWLGFDVALPEDVKAPELWHCYRALDHLADAKDATEVHLYRRLTDLTNLDLRLALYDLTSTYFETDERSSARFPSRAFGYSRDHRSDRPQVVIGLLVTGDGIPIAHHVFPGNTRDSTTLSSVMADYQARFGVGRIALVADRGLISEDNVEAVAAAGFDHVLATRLHNDAVVRSVLEEADAPTTSWTAVADLNCEACDLTFEDKRYVVIDSAARHARDGHLREELLANTEDKLIALATRVREKMLSDAAKIGAATDRILRDSGVGRCFSTKIKEGFFTWDYDQEALAYEEDLLEGRYVLTTSLTTKQASTAEIVRHYRALQKVERRFRVLKDFLGLRPIYHWTERRVRGHIAICVLAAVIEAVMTKDLARAGVMDPDLTHQVLSPRRALAELDRIRLNTIEAGERHVTVVTRRNALQVQVLKAFGVDTSSWDRATIA